MRGILIDWLVEVHLKFQLLPETLFLTVSLLDRYLELETIQRSKLQLLGMTAMFIASKYEEVHPPEAQDWVYISDKAYSRHTLLAMEGKVRTAAARPAGVDGGWGGPGEGDSVDDSGGPSSRQVLSTLRFQITFPSPLVFLQRFAAVVRVAESPCSKTEFLAQVRVTLLDPPPRPPFDPPPPSQPLSAGRLVSGRPS